MAMQKTIEVENNGTPTGIQADYHKITRPGQYDYQSKQGTCYMGSFVDKAARDAEKAYIGYDYPVSFDLSKFPEPAEPTRENIYKFLSAQEGGKFFGATEI